MAESNERRDVIRELILSDEIASQEELLDKLARRGFHASQPVLSRDLRALNVAKQAGVYRLHEEERVTPLEALKSLLRSEQSVQHFVLLRCEPGAASAVARALEAEELDGLIGTIAGDDTVLVAASTHAASQRIRRRVQDLL